MSRKSDNIPINNRKLDRRVKLTNKQRVNIKNSYIPRIVSAQTLADKYGVSKKLIQIIIDPNKQIANLKRREERGGTMQYYNKEKHLNYMKKHKNYKKELFEQGLLKKHKKILNPLIH